MSRRNPVQQSRQPQPPRLSNQQNPSDSSQSQNLGKIVPITPSQIFPTSHTKNPTQDNPASPSNIANRYLVSTILKPNYERPSYGQPSYSSALASPAPKAINPYQVEEHFSPIQKPSSYPTKEEDSHLMSKRLLPSISLILNPT